MSLKNKWRRIGSRFEVRRVSGRYHDGTLDGRDVLWIRSHKVQGVGRAIAWCDTDYDKPQGRARLGLSLYYPAQSNRDAIATGKAMLRHVRRRLAELESSL